MLGFPMFTVMCHRYLHRYPRCNEDTFAFLQRGTCQQLYDEYIKKIKNERVEMKRMCLSWCGDWKLGIRIHSDEEKKLKKCLYTNLVSFWCTAKATFAGFWGKISPLELDNRAKPLHSIWHNDDIKRSLSPLHYIWQNMQILKSM